MPSNPMVVNAGLAIISGLVSQITSLVPKYIGIGTGSTAPTTADTGLQTPTSDARATGTVTRTTVTATNDTMQVVGTVSIGGTEAITEWAMFDASTSGNMYCRGTFSALNLVSGDSLTLTVKATWTGG